MKKAELRVGRHVWVGGRYGEEAYILDAEPNWDEYRWSTRGQGRWTKGNGKRVAVAKRSRLRLDDVVRWEPDTAVLGQIVDFEERAEQLRRERQYVADQRQAEQDRYQERVNREDRFNERLSAILGPSSYRWASLSPEGVRMSESVLEGLLTRLENAQ